MDIQCFHSLAQVERFRDELDALNRTSRQRDPFSTFSFLENFGRHDKYYPRDHEAEPWFLIASEHGRALGYLALRRVIERAFGLASPKLEFFATHDSCCPHLVARPEDEARCAEAFHRYLLSRADEWSFLELQQQDASSALFPPPAAIDFGRYYVRAFPTLDNNVVPIRWPTLGEYLRSLSGHFRSDVRRKMRALLAAGEASYVSSKDPAATPVLFELLRNLEARTSGPENAPAIGSHPDRVEYFRGLLAAHQPMRAHLGLVLLDGVPIAGGLCGGYEQTLYCLVVTFDPAFERLAPGAALMLMQVGEAIDGGHRALNLLPGLSYYKRRWLAERRPTVSGQLFRVGRPRYLRVRLGDCRRRIVADHGSEPAIFEPPHRQSTRPRLPCLSVEERATVDRLMKQLASLPVEWVDKQGLRELIFEPGRRPGPVMDAG